MKLLVVILSIFTISLSAIPCDDNLDIYSDVSISVSQDTHSDSHDDTDACSPFCTCVCCATVVVNEMTAQDVLIAQTGYSEINSSYTFYYTSDYLNRIFQPPQV